MPPADEPANLEGIDSLDPIAIKESNEVQESPQLKPRVPSRTSKAKTKKNSVRLASLVAVSATVLGIAALALGGYKFFRTAESNVREQGRYRVSVHDIEVTPVPVWIHSDLLAQVQSLAELPDTVNTLDAHLAERLHDAFAMHPWIRGVIEVRIAHPNRIRVSLQYREPVAIVQTPRSLEAVDREGVLLPATELPNPQLYITVTGVRSTPTGPAGTKWRDPALAAAVETADVISPHHRTLGLTTIDAGTYQANMAKPGFLSLLTERGTRVKWGRPPTPDYPGEVPVQDKIDRLLKYVAENGSLDQPAGPYEIDITHWQEIGVRPRSRSSAPVRPAAAKTPSKR